MAAASSSTGRSRKDNHLKAYTNRKFIASYCPRKYWRPSVLGCVAARPFSTVAAASTTIAALIVLVKVRRVVYSTFRCVTRASNGRSRVPTKSTRCRRAANCLLLAAERRKKRNTAKDARAHTLKHSHIPLIPHVRSQQSNRQPGTCKCGDACMQGSSWLCMTRTRKYTNRQYVMA